MGNQRSLEELAKHLMHKIKRHSFNNQGELELEVEPHKLFKLLVILKEEASSLFEQLIDITAVDYPEKEKRFKLVYHFLSIAYNQRVRVISYLSAEDEIKSVTSIYPNANWYEREIFDMFGLEFKEHPNLCRILTDYDFKGHPLRKDFPLKGTHEIFYDKDLDTLGYKPL